MDDVFNGKQTLCLTAPAYLCMFKLWEYELFKNDCKTIHIHLS